jgi:hypothetical protein
MGGVAKEYITKTWMWKIFLQGHIRSTAGDARMHILYTSPVHSGGESLIICSFLSFPMVPTFFICHPEDSVAALSWLIYMSGLLNINYYTLQRKKEQNPLKNILLNFYFVYFFLPLSAGTLLPMFNEKIICKRYSWKKKGGEFFIDFFLKLCWESKHPTCEKTFLFQTVGLLLQQTHTTKDVLCRLPQLLKFF